jgi:hypothetical protein
MRVDTFEDSIISLFPNAPTTIDYNLHREVKRISILQWTYIYIYIYIYIGLLIVVTSYIMGRKKYLVVFSSYMDYIQLFKGIDQAAGNHKYGTSLNHLVWLSFGN